MLANDPVIAIRARALLETVRSLSSNERERVHLAALSHAVEGHRAAAVAILDRHLMRYPLDLLAHFGALFLDAFLGRFPWVSNRSARALPFWSKAHPGYAMMLSFYGFGLEEAGNYTRAEDVSHAAAELEPHSYWALHAMSHVMEMTGRPSDGLALMATREPLWSAKDNLSQVHIWWHRALFHVELGQYEDALKIYDGPVLATQRPVAISLTNASALLWRLETLGCDAGSRWKDLALLWEGRADGKLCVFMDIHAAMTSLRAENGREFDKLVAAMRKTAADGTEAASIYRDIGLPVVQGLAAFSKRSYVQAVDHLLPARFDLWKMGGSQAQRDVIDWTLTEAAVRGGLREVALSLAHERLWMRPESAPNHRFLRRAEEIAA